MPELVRSFHRNLLILPALDWYPIVVHTDWFGGSLFHPLLNMAAFFFTRPKEVNGKQYTSNFLLAE